MEYENSEGNEFLRQEQPPLVDPTTGGGNVDFFPINGGGTFGQKTFLAFDRTLNGLIPDTLSLTDLLFGLFFPAFGGYMAFDRHGKIYIDSRKPTAHTFVRQDVSLRANFTPSEIPVTNVKAIHGYGGYLLIGAGQANGEIRTEQGVRYVHTQTTVKTRTIGSIQMTTQRQFIEQQNAPSVIRLKFSGTPQQGNRMFLEFETPIVDNEAPRKLAWDWYVDSTGDTLDVVAAMFKTRLEASPTFSEFWTCRINQLDRTELFIEFQGGYLRLNKPLEFSHKAGEEIMHVVEVYENFKDASNPNGRKDNIKSFRLNSPTSENYQTVKGTYISAIEDFTEVEVLPRTAWDTVEDEREMNVLEMDLSMVDSYRQAASIVKRSYIDHVVGAFPATLETGNEAMFHQEDDVIAVRHQILEDTVTYLPMKVNSVAMTSEGFALELKLYLSAAYDSRVAKEEKRFESTLTPVTDASLGEPSRGSFSSVRTGDGAGDTPQDKLFSYMPYMVLPKRYHTTGADKI
jgi:hypothetical protein